MFLYYRAGENDNIRALILRIGITQHKEAEVEGFTKRYGCNQLVYYEFSEDMPNAIAREKQLKGGSRKKKIALIESMNPTWQILYEDLI